MKKTTLTILILFFGLTPVFSQMIFDGRSEEKTLFSDARPCGGFVAFTGKPAFVNGHEAYITGGQAAVVLGKKVNMGVAGFGLLTDVGSDQFATDGTEYFVEMGYGGLLIEPVFGSDRLIHITTPVILGGGVATLSKNRPWDPDYMWDEYTDPEFFFVAEPSVNAELNLFRFMRIAAGVGYRFIGETGIFRSTNTELSGWSGNVTLKLGWF